MNKSDTMAFLMTFSPVIILVVAFLIFAVPAGFKAISETKPCFSDNVAEITRLREENARLREALKPFAEMLKGNYSYQSDDMLIKAGANQYDLVFDFTLGDLRAARDALKEPGDEKTGI